VGVDSVEVEEGVGGLAVLFCTAVSGGVHATCEAPLLGV
jgi:hypothetical protein